MKLINFNFEIIYKKDKENKVSDALFRNFINIICDKTEINAVDNLTTNDIKTFQFKDKFCLAIVSSLNDKEVPTKI